mgnify:CR=1 FL=1
MRFIIIVICLIFSNIKFIVATLIFSPLVLVRIQSTAAQLFVYISNALGNDTAGDIIDKTGEAPDHIGVSISIAGLLGDDAQGTSKLLKEFAKENDSERLLKVLEPVIAPFFAFVVALVLVALCALAAVIMA